MQESSVPVLIAGGCPCGLMLANELGRRGIGALLVDEKPSTAFDPQANARTMEHFRRLGFADEVRSLGLPPEFLTDIAYFTRFARALCASFGLTDGRSLYDTFGFEWTLLRMRRDSPVAEDIAKAARGLALDLTVVDLDDDARDLYEADAALIRPDQIVAWRGSGPCDALQAVARMSGQYRTASGPSSPSPSAIGLSSGGQSATVPVE
jgi:hypothetical protein